MNFLSYVCNDLSIPTSDFAENGEKESEHDGRRLRRFNDE